MIRSPDQGPGEIMIRSPDQGPRRRRLCAPAGWRAPPPPPPGRRPSARPRRDPPARPHAPLGPALPPELPRPGRSGPGKGRSQGRFAPPARSVRGLRRRAAAAAGDACPCLAVPAAACRIPPSPPPAPTSCPATPPPLLSSVRPLRPCTSGADVRPSAHAVLRRVPSSGEGEGEGGALVASSVHAVYIRAGRRGSGGWARSLSRALQQHISRETAGRSLAQSGGTRTHAHAHAHQVPAGGHACVRACVYRGVGWGGGGGGGQPGRLS